MNIGIVGIENVTELNLYRFYSIAQKIEIS